ncbi:M57 family metalloprotease [Dawidia soli]|uniref:DUF5648 domain-containing protein n=1 Tax=Dawidia soli TaxID=2782352 RepID=A0AAP2GF79_9BACT|nr:M57 family metalloprotease [Dawidia soli]MBT1689212.1 hypothetical protein [Dawidia soli]
MHNVKFPLGKILSLLAILSMLFGSCQQDNDVQPTGSQTSANDIAVLKSFLSETTGTPLNDITFADDTFLIDGDMVMPLQNARDHYVKSQTEKSAAGRTEQRQYMYLLTPAVAANITVYINTDVPAVWVTAINQAISNWNTGADSKIHASVTTTAAGASITVSMNAAIEPGVIARALLPDAAGNAGSTVQINPAYTSSLPASQKQFAMTHEFGHNFGFRHTDQTNGTLITDTPVTDANSVMNSVVLNWNGFTFYDFIAFGVVYPHQPGTRRLLRYYSSANTDHFYTIHTNEIGPTGNGWAFEGGSGYVYATPTPGTVPLYRYYDAVTMDHFYTMNFGEVSWTYEGVACYVSATQVAGTRPLYRYFNTVTKDHFYTLHLGEVSGPSWTYEGIACYVWQP